MAGPKIPVLPPIAQAPFVGPQGILTQSSLALLQQIWTAAFGLGGITPGVLLLGSANNVNFNTAGDTQVAIALPSGSLGWRSLVGMIWGTQGTFTTAQAGLYSAGNQQGQVLNGQSALSAITATGFNVGNVITTVLTPAQTAIFNHTTIFLNVGTRQGGLSVGNFYLYGYPVF